MMKLLSLFLFLFAYFFNLAPADAIPTYARRNNPRMVTMPLRSLHAAHGTDIHPQVLLQQHINRASIRLARMTGREAPSDHALRSELRERLHLSESAPGSRPGTPPTGQGPNPHPAVMPVVTTVNDDLVTEKINDTTGNSNGTVAGGTSIDISTNTGVSSLDIQAAIKGGLTAANPPTTNDSLGLDISGNDVGYVATVYIGTPPRGFDLLMDTGSGDLWVLSENVQSNHTTLGAKSSSSFVQGNQQFNITYGTGAAQGVLCHDNINITDLELKNHIFGIATNESEQFVTSPFDGIMGLSQSTLSEERVPTVLESLATNKLISAPIASFKISRLSDQLNDGEITFGGLDTTKFVANTLVTVPSVSQVGFWEAEMGAITVNGTSTGLSGRTAILDTGTTLILVPASDAQNVMRSLGGSCNAKQCTIPCTTQASLAFSFGNTSFAIEPKDLAVLPLNSNDPTGDCSAGIQPGQFGTSTQWLVGDVFLKNAYFSINAATKQISLAKLATS